MQNFKNIASTDLLSVSRQDIMGNLETIKSQSSGNTYPTMNLQEGMPFYNTADKCVYVLTDVVNQTWKKVLDTVNAFGNAKTAETATTADKTKATSAPTTKSFVMGTTGTGTTPNYDPAVYLGTTAGELVATKFTGDLNGNAKTATNAVNAVNATKSGGYEIGNVAGQIPVYNSSGHLVLPSGAEIWVE